MTKHMNSNLSLSCSNPLCVLRLCSIESFDWLIVRHKTSPALLAAPLGEESCCSVIASVHKGWVRMRRTRQRDRPSWVSLSLWVSAGPADITENQSLCKWDQWDANNRSSAVSLFQTVCSHKPTQTLLSPSRSKQQELSEKSSTEGRWVCCSGFGSMLTVMDRQQQKNSSFSSRPLMKSGESCGSVLAAQMSATHSDTISRTPPVRFDFSPVVQKKRVSSHFVACAEWFLTLLFPVCKKHILCSLPH